MNDDINQEILAELRKLRRQSQVSVYMSLLALAVLAAYVAFFTSAASSLNCSARHSGKTAATRCAGGPVGRVVEHRIGTGPW